MKIKYRILEYLLILLGGAILFTLILSGGLTVALVIAKDNGSLQKWVNLALDPVHISYQTAKVSWYRGSPRLDLDQVEVSDQAKMQNPLDIGHFSIDLSVWRSLLAWAPVANRIQLSGVNLRLIQQPDGYFKLQDYNDQPDAPPMTASPLMVKWFLAQQALGLDHIVLQTTLRNQRVVNVQIDQVSWKNRFDYQFDISGDIAEAPGSYFELEAHFKPGSDPQNLSQWHLKFNGALEADSFEPILGAQIFQGLSWSSGGGQIQFDGTAFDQSLQNLNVDVALSHLNLSNHTTQQLIAPQFDEHIVWSRTPDQSGGWQLGIFPLHQIDLLGPAYDSALKITYAPQAKDYIWALNAQKVDLDVLGEWINFWFQPYSKTATMWNMIHPSGQIDQFNFATGPLGGQASFSSQKLQFSGNPLFPNAWPASQVAVAANWKKNTAPQAMWKVTIQNAAMQNQWLQLAINGTLNVPVNNPGNPILNLKAQFTGKNLEQVKAQYIPQGKEVSAALSHWLQTGLLQLPAVNGTLTWQGALSQFPYATGKGLFNLAIQVKNGVIAPYPGWPRISQINANLLFHNQAMTIDAQNVQTFNIPVEKVHFEIADLRPKSHDPIEITGSSHLTGTQALGYIAAMPLTPAGVDQFLLSSKLSGALDLALKLTIPLEGEEPITAAGTVTLNHNNWFINKNNKTPLLANLQGQVQFVNQMISGLSLSTDAMSQTLNFAILTSPVDSLKFLISSFRVFGQVFHQVQLGIEPNNNHILFNLNGPEIAGTVDFAGQNEPVSAHFTQLRLSAISTHAMPVLNPAVPSAESVATLPKVPLLGSAIAGLPVITFSIDHLFYNDKDIGSVHWGSSPVPNGIMIQQFILTSTPIQINAGGEVQTMDGQDHIQVSGHFNTKNYGQVLQELGYPGVLRGGSGPIDLNLSWLGGLHIDYATLNGTMKFDISNGTFLQINTGFAKIFGLFSLESIIDTLSFNFQKVFGSGLSFDTLSGSYAVVNGVATTDNFRMNGSALNMSMKGEIDLVHETINQKITVMPQLGAGIAVAAGIVATPIAGVAAWFADKILTNTLFKNMGVVMSVTGPLSNPKVGQ